MRNLKQNEMASVAGGIYFDVVVPVVYYDPYDYYYGDTVYIVDSYPSYPYGNTYYVDPGYSYGYGYGYAPAYYDIVIY